jgi:hypothetical protein
MAALLVEGLNKKVVVTENGQWSRRYLSRPEGPRVRIRLPPAANLTSGRVQ